MDAAHEQGTSRKVITLDPAILATQAAQIGVISTESSRVMQAASANRNLEYKGIETSLENLGVPANLIRTPECYLYLVVLDDSGSIKQAGAEEDVRSAYNLYLSELQASKEMGLIRSDALIAVVGLNRGVIHPYARIENARQLSPDEYQADGGTPLYDIIVQAARLQTAKATELTINGISANTITLFFTDGDDQHSKLSASDVSEVIRDLAESRHHIVAGMYRGAAKANSFQQMGIPPEWILKAGNTPAQLLETFSRLSKASQSASRGAQAFADVKKRGVTIG